MDPATGGIIGSSIIAAASLIGNVFLFLRGGRQKRKVNDLEAATVSVSKSYAQEVTERYGFRAKCARSKLKIDLEGNSRETREWQEVSTNGIKLPYIPHSFWVDRGQITREPTLIPDLVRPRDFPKDVSLRVVRGAAEGNELQFRVEISGGGLAKEDGELSYGYKVECSNAYCMTREELTRFREKDLFKYEYNSFEVLVPLDLLELEVEFAQGYAARCWPGVFLAGTDSMHDIELKGARKGFSPTSNGACFRIEKPLPGFSYRIYWMPPFSESLDKLRKAVDNKKQGSH